MTRLKRFAVPVLATVAAIVFGGGIAWAVSVPNSGGQLTGTVYVCVNTAHENQQYVELGHPAPGNCAAGYLQYTANQPAPSSAPSNVPSEFTNSQVCVSAAGNTAAGDTQTCPVTFPFGSHLDSVVSVTDLDATVAAPDTVTAAVIDHVAGTVKLTFSAASAGHSIQITYDYSG